ncbi:YdeI/OmpD-associated family protein [Sediminibacterium goheungense]|uniref:Uncharacterized protein DUF1905 n=1 Tax=Sediminibacterium goheungense TaxID=1086393 RepID=A0A4R6IN40_9BACT|nr:DUF1905 domain-containing protein [Sediminibacterium goheungense]TDO23644.1 uncharacterized protein DUF1905 [Sediminibacterium goheungense]
MKTYKDQQAIGQLEKRKGGYYYFMVTAATANALTHQHKTRLICTIDKTLTFQCGLNHLGDGNFFIIISTKKVKELKKKIGDKIDITLQEDPNPLGVEIPEVLTALLDQDEDLKKKYDQFTMGKKRSVIHAITRLKDMDKQISMALKIINGQLIPGRKKTS